MVLRPPSQSPSRSSPPAARGGCGRISSRSAPSALRADESQRGSRRGSTVRRPRGGRVRGRTYVRIRMVHGGYSLLGLPHERLRDRGLLHMPVHLELGPYFARLRRVGGDGDAVSAPKPRDALPRPLPHPRSPQTGRGTRARPARTCSLNKPLSGFHERASFSAFMYSDFTLATCSADAGDAIPRPNLRPAAGRARARRQRRTQLHPQRNGTRRNEPTAGSTVAAAEGVPGRDDGRGERGEERGARRESEGKRERERGVGG